MLHCRWHLDGILVDLGAVLERSWDPKSKKCRIKSVLKFVKVLNRFSTDSKSRIGMKFYSLGENSFLTIEFLRFPL